MSDSMREMLSGLREPSLTSLVTTLAVSIGVVVAFAIAVSQGLGTRADLLALGSRDDFAFASARALSLAREASDKPALVVTGGSNVREAYTDESSLAAQASSGATQYEGFYLATNGQRLWELIAILDLLPRDRPALVALHVSPWFLSASHDELEGIREHPRLGFRSRALDEEMMREGIEPSPRFGIELIDNLDFYLLRLPALMDTLLGGARRVMQRHRYLEGQRASLGYWNLTVGMILSRLENFSGRLETNMAALERAIRRLYEHGNKTVVFVESPVNPLFLSRHVPEEIKRRYESRFRQFASCLGIDYWTIQEALDLGPDVFFDWSHLNSSAVQALMTKTLAARIAGYSPPPPPSGSACAGEHSR